MAEKITGEMLSDGSVLLNFKKRFALERSQENLVSLLICLHDSTVCVPLTMKMSERDEEKFKNAGEGEEVECEDEVHLSPDIFKTEDGAMYFPIFSQREQISEEYSKDFSVMPFSVGQCLEMAHSVDGVCGLVLDPLTEPLPLPFEIADMIEKLPSMISE